MRTIVLVCLFAVAATAAVLPDASYIPPAEKLSSEYLPPTEEVAEVKEAIEQPSESAALADDGYRYKTLRTLKYRQRRDVSEIVAPEYLPPAEEALSSEYIPPAEVKEAVEATEVPEDSAVLADDGYRYKTIRKLKYRQRRDVSEIVSPQYLPPSEEAVATEYIPPAEVKEAVEAPEESAALADDGYRYKTIRKLKYRHRRDVSETVSPQYLPPSEEAVAAEYIPPAEVKEAAEATEAPEESAALADDGYRYKAIRKLKYRHRRDVSEIVSPQYLPPSEEAVAAEYIPPAEVKEAAEATEAPEDSAVLADDGYRYKTIRKLKYRQRRDVSEIVSPQYLPPSEEAVAAEYIPPAEVKEAAEATEAPEDSAVLADDGYRYKTIRKLKYRQRRDVSEIVSPQYLPPSEEAVAAEYIPPAEVKEAVEATESPEDSAVLADDGYRYKTIRKLKYRQRRDVSEIVSPQYLPPSEEAVAAEYIPPAEVKEAVEATEAPEDSAVLADDGYRYKTIRKLKYRQRRDVLEIVSPQYLPPSEEAVATEYIPPAEVKEAVEAPEESAALAEDGYRYKTIRKLKYRQRRDVSEIVSPQYLPPSEEAVATEYIPPAEVKEAVEAPEESAALAEDGYRYKTIRKLKYRQRRDVSEIVSPQYLPPSEEAVATEYIPPAEVKEAVEAPEESAALADDGYRYKTIRKLKYRQRRDVSEIVSPQYLPPSEEAVATEYIPPAEVKEAVESPEESAALADDGYRYKTIRKLKYRQRRDVSEIVSPQYLPPSEEAVATEYIPPAEVKEAVEATEAPEESAALADDGYRYKTIRKLKYRHRRDVSEILAPEYLPPVEKSASEYLPPAIVEEVAEVTEIPAEKSAILADDGYRYKTVKRIRYRH